MKTMLELMARYNKEANKQMLKVLDSMDEELLHKDIGLYHKSILATMVHYTAGDASFFKDYFASFCDSKPNALKIDAMLEAPFTMKGEIIQHTSNLFAARGEIDEYIAQVIANISDFSATKTLEFPWGSMSKPIYQYIWAILNHATHHRGAIAGALDTLKIDNDFNGALGV